MLKIPLENCPPELIEWAIDFQEGRLPFAVVVQADCTTDNYTNVTPIKPEASPHKKT